MEEELRAQLLANAGLAALVATRIDWGVRPQGDPLPGVVLVRASRGISYSQSGASGFELPRLQAHCWGATPAQAERVARAMIAALATLQPPLTVGFVGDLAPHLPPQPAGDARAPIHRAFLDVQVGFQST